MKICITALLACAALFFPVSAVSAFPADAPAWSLDAAGNLHIHAGQVTAKPLFIPLKAGETSMEIIAVRDGNGEIRAAFNTCRICNGAPRTYFVHQSKLFAPKGFVCQNCGNVFSAKQLGLQGNGCHPLAIPNLSTAVENIIIPADVLIAHTPFFRNWERGL